MMRPEAPAHHAAHRGARQPERGGEIDRDDLVPVLVLHAHEKIVAGDAGIVDQNIDVPHGGFGGRHQLLDLGRVGQIAGQHMDAAAQLAGQRVERSSRVPEMATVAPLACSACAIAPPMPPVAPVTSAVLPVRSNISVSPSRLGRLRGKRPRASSSKQSTSSGVPTDVPTAPSAMRLTRPLSTLPAPISKNRVTPCCRHIGHAFAPAHGAGDLLDQPAARSRPDR